MGFQARNYKNYSKNICNIDVKKNNNMSLIKSISGIRGTIGGKYNDNLTAIDIVECTAAYGQYLIENGKGNTVIIGRDGRISGPMVSGLVCNTLISMGLHVIDLGLSTTPTVEMAVVDFKAVAGIIITASHNPAEWNALKFLNENGEFISAETGTKLLKYIDDANIHFADVNQLGTISQKSYKQEHIDHILALDLVKTDLIKKKSFHVVVDCINSTGALFIPPLLDQLGCTYVLIHGEVNGKFAHNPEPKEEHLMDLASAVKSNKADLGIAVDPDVDRLAFMNSDGSMFGEEYTLVAIADYILGHKKGPTVSNLSSTLALRDISIKHGVQYAAAAVGEVNVVNKMKEIKAVIGGEGNGGVIFPELHYGRDALVGIALMLSYMAESNKSSLEIKASLPFYEMSKDKIDLDNGTDVDAILKNIAEHFKNEEVSTIDGVKVVFQNEWVHLRKSNTEPIIRIYAESSSKEKADSLVQGIKDLIMN